MLSGMSPDELFKPGELLFDDVDGRLVSERERFLVELLGRERDQDFRLAE